jgi:predicted permease
MLDLKHALRMLRKTPGLSLLAITTLALGIGAATALFSVLSGVVLNPLPFREPDRLLRIFETNPQTDSFTTSEANFLDMRAQTRTLFDIAAVRSDARNLTSDGEPQTLSLGAVSANLFDLLGVPPALGTGFAAEDDTPGNPARRIVLGHALWRSRWGGDPGVVGRAISLDGQLYTVAGVMPPGFDYPGGIQAYVPLGASKSSLRAQHLLVAVGRLAPGIRLAQARSDMNGIATEFARLYPASNRNWGIRLLPLRDDIIGPPVARTMWVLFGAVMLVLVMACANIANLLMAKATTRTHEVTLRLALGATRWRIVRQLLTESALLALAGAALGVGLASIGVSLLRGVSFDQIPRLDQIGIDGRVLAFTAAVAFASAIAFGLAPALQGLSPQLHATLGSGPRTAGNKKRHRLIGILVSAEIALAMVLLVGAGLMMKTVVALTHVNPGFRVDHMLQAAIALPPTAYKGEQMIQLYRELDRELASLPGVDGAGGISVAPELDGNTYTRFLASGRPQRDDEFLMANWRTTTPNFFSAMAIPLLQGRLITDGEFNPDARVALVNRTAAERWWPGDNPLGKIVTPYARQELHYTVVGVVGDVRDVALNTPPDAAVYFAGRPWPAMTYFIHTTGEPGALAAAVRARVRSVSPNLPVTITTLRQTLSNSIVQPRLSGALLAIFSWVALALALTGIFGVISFSVAQQTREIGIRMALGAQPADVLRVFLRRGFLLAGIGVSVGLAGALASMRLLQSLLFGVAPTDPWILGGVALLLGAVAVLASYLAARKAVRVEPLVALRTE